MAWEMMDVPFEDFFDLFNQFSYEVKVKNYSKMDYSMWKGLRDALHSCSDDVISVDLHADRIVVEILDYGCWQFMLNDHSFGDYLYYWLFSHWNKKEYITDPNGHKFAYTVSKNQSNIKNIDNDVTCENAKEDNKMKFNFDFGPVDSNIRMSPFGMAIKNAEGTYVSYNAADNQIVDVDVFNFNGTNFMFKMPVALNDVKPGDIVVHQRKPMFVTNIDGNILGVIDIYSGEAKGVVPTTNMFGFNFVTKVISFLDMGTPSQDNPFGNMWPLFMMNDSKMDSKQMFMFMLMMGQNKNAPTNMFQNPLFLMAFMQDGGMGDMGPMVMAMMMNQNQFQGCNCQCGGHKE